MEWPSILTHPLNRAQTKQLAKEFLGNVIRIVVDVEDKTVAAGGRAHVDAQTLLLKHGSKGKNIWGINYFPAREKGKRLDYTALINNRPRSGNPSQEVRDPDVRKKIKDILNDYFDL